MIDHTVNDHSVKGHPVSDDAVMDEQTSARGTLARTAMLSGAAFVVGGLARLPLLAIDASVSTGVLLSVLVGFVGVQAVVGCAVLARRFSDEYPVRRMWAIGVAALVVGSLGPILVLGPYYIFFYAIVGVLVGLAFGLPLRRDRAARRMVAACGAGYFVAFMVMLTVGSAMNPIGDWWERTMGSAPPDALLGSVPFAAGDFVVGVTLALAVAWALKPADFRLLASAQGALRRPRSAG